MAVTIGELLVNLRASTASFAKDLDKAAQLSFNTSREIERSFKFIAGAIAGALTAATVAVTGLAEHAIETADHFNKLSQSTGLSVEQFSGLAYAAGLADVETGALSKSLVILSKNLEKSNQQTLEGKAAHSALATLFHGSIPFFKDTNDAFTQIAQQLSLLPNGYTKTALAAQIFGKQGASLIPLLNEGAAGLDKLRAEAERLGIIFDEKTSKAAEKFNDDLKRLKAAAEGLGNSIAKELLPTLVLISEAAVGAAKSQQPFENFIKILGNFAAVLTQGLPAMAAVRANLEALGQTGKEQFQILGGVTTQLDRLFDSLSKGLHQKFGLDVTPFRELTDEEKKLAAAINTVLDNLKVGIATIGQTKFQVEQYKLAIEGASVAELAHIRALHTKLEGLIQIQKPLASIIKLTDQQIAQIGQQIEITKQLAAQEDARSTARLGELLQEGSAIDQVLAKGIEESQKLGGALQVPLKPLRDMTAEADKFGQRLGRSLSDAIIHGSGFSQLLKSIIQQFEEMIIKLTIIDPLIDALESGGHSAGSGGFLGFFSSLLSGFRAGGGPVSAGGAYVVGEKGPEIFSPNSSGTIIPNGVSAGGKVQVIYQIDARGSSITEEQFIRSMKQFEERAVARSIHTQRELSLRSA